MGGKEKQGKEQILVSLISCVIMTILLAVLIVTETVEKEIVIIMAGGMILWPIIEFLNYKFEIYSLKGEKRNLLELKLSVVSWAIMCTGIIIINLLLTKEVTWSIYPTAVIMLWPIYNLFLYLTEAYSLKK